MWTRHALGIFPLLLLIALVLPSRAAACVSAADCDDANPCTDDLCDADLGCVYAEVNNPCDDGNACSTGDTCSAGACIGGAVAGGCTSCQAIATIPSGGGTFVGATSGTGSSTGSCGSTGPSPERMYRWTPSTSGTAVIATCGSGTLYDSVVHVHANTCGGAELGCNDDTTGCTTGEPNDHHGSRVAVNVAAGQTYVIVVDGYNGARGTYTLTVSPPSVCGNGVREGSEECDGGNVAACPSGQCTASCTCVPPANGLPDLVPEIVDVSVAFNTTVASGDVVEGCAEATSGVDLLRFGAYSRNLGTADFTLGDPLCPTPCDEHPLELCGDPDFICSPAQGHNHAHYNNYARYDLLDANGQTIVVGHKQGYCLRDTDCAAPVYTCTNQGITAGCSDLYGANLGCQYLDITGVPGGTYTLRVTIDPFGRIAELSEANNVVQQSVTIRRTTPTPTRTPTPTPTRTPTPSPTATVEPSATPAPTGSDGSTATATTTPDATVTTTPIATLTATPLATPIAGCGTVGVIPPEGGTVAGTTSGGTSTLAGTCATSANSPERVYQWTPATSGTALVQTCGSGTLYDSVVHVHAGACSGPEVACNDDTAGCTTGEPNDHHGSRLSFTVTAGQTYLLVVDGYNGAAGAYTLIVTAPAPPARTATPTPVPTRTRTPTPLRTATPTRTATPARTATPTITPTPAASACTSPIVIASEGGVFGGTTTGTSTLTATCASTSPAPETVYQWTPTRSGSALIETCGAATTFDTVVSVRAQSCANGQERACNDDTSGCTTGEPNDHHGSRLTVQVTAGQTYFIVVDGYAASRGTYQLRVVAP